jgi:hypothetical protein
MPFRSYSDPGSFSKYKHPEQKSYSSKRKRCTSESYGSATNGLGYIVRLPPSSAVEIHDDVSICERSLVEENEEIATVVSEVSAARTSTQLASSNETESLTSRTELSNDLIQQTSKISTALPSTSSYCTLAEHAAEPIEIILRNVGCENGSAHSSFTSSLEFTDSPDNYVGVLHTDSSSSDEEERLELDLDLME